MDKQIYYIYDSHTCGEYYVSDEELDCPICEQCGDSDSLVYAGTYNEILKDIKFDEYGDGSPRDVQIVCREYDYVKGLLDEYIKKENSDGVSE